MAEAAALKTTKSSDKSHEAELKDLYAMLDVLKADMKELTRTVGEVGKAEANRAVDTAKAKGKEVKAAGEAQIDALRTQAEDYGRATGQYVRENPTAALGIAAGLGLLVGFMLSGRR
ncbi:MAG: DUF883 domain-containing protein [Boseongicola sp.]|nr:DUF883 domain-containing protein [Boseongicola sp.]